MNPDILLGILAAVLGFALKTTLAFGVCLALSWLANSPNRRFIVWVSFLFCAAAYWAWLAIDVLRVLIMGRSSATASGAAASHVASAAGALQIPAAWSFPLSIAFRAIAIAYLLALAYLLFTYIKEKRQLKWVLGFTTKPPVEIADIFQPLAQGLRGGRARLLVLSGIVSPATFGWIRPTILLPDVCLQQDRSELEDILRHELHHIRRWDFVWNGFAIVCRALLFFHPAAWYAVRRMQFERELACDLAVVSDSPEGRARYAECLIHFARLNASQDPRAWGVDFAASSEHLKARVQSILAGSKSTSNWLLGLRIACGTTLMAGFVCVVPSLTILLSYGHQQVSQPAISPTSASASMTEPLSRATRKARAARHLVPTSGNVADASSSKAGATEPIATLPAAHGTVGPSTQQSSGPQLLHRSQSAGAGHNSAPKQQTVVLIDGDDSGQIVKTGDHDRKQALQQSITAAAGIYKRLGAVDDRH
jgi:beta-lactamase regulating signal transducer with metallopeptidase domain